MKKRPAGATLICVLVCLGVASTITIGVLRSSLQQRRQLQHHWQLEQTQWLLEAGFQRALRVRSEQQDYSGETWELGDAFGDETQASVEIAFESPKGSASADRLRVSARLQSRDLTPIITRRSHFWNVESRSPTSESSSNEASQ